MTLLPTESSYGDVTFGDGTLTASGAIGSVGGPPTDPNAIFGTTPSPQSTPGVSGELTHIVEGFKQIVGYATPQASSTMQISPTTLIVGGVVLGVVVLVWATSHHRRRR